MEFNFLLHLVADLDEKTNEVTIKKVIPINTSVDNNNEFLKHIITKSEAKYGILTLGKDAKKIGITTNTFIKIVKIDENVVKKDIKTHKTITGRLDGLTDLYSNHLLSECDNIEVTFDIKKSILRINHIKI